MNSPGGQGMTPMLLIACAGLMGAAGVVLLAAGAHGPHAGSGLDSAGQMLLFHAAAAIGVAAALHQGLLFRPLALAAVRPPTPPPTTRTRRILLIRRPIHAKLR